MDKVLADTLIANLKAAKTPDEVRQAQMLALIAMVDCQLKTADRVKELLSARADASSRRAVVVWVSRALWAFGSGGGFVVVAKLAKIAGVL